MEGIENNEREPTPLKIDPKCFQDALRSFFQPIKTEDPRLDFYTMYKREAMEYDTDYVRKYDEDLNTTLIFAGLFSAVSSAFVIDVHSKLQPDPNEQSAALLRAILLTLNQSAIPNETPAVPPVQKNTPSDIVIVTGLLYASLIISLLAAFIAMLGKQWLNRYLRKVGGSMIERCGDRQRKCDGFQKWSLHYFVESLPVMLQIALLLLACGLCRYMVPINTAVASVLIALVLLGVLFYVGIVIAGTSSYDCPFQTPASDALRSLWTKIGPYLMPTTVSIATTLHYLGESFQYHVFRIVTRLPHVNIIHRLRNLVERVQLGILRIGLCLPRTELSIRLRRHPPLPTIQENSQLADSQEIVPWLTSKDLTTIRMTSINDTRCVSWILRNITDPEALDAAIRLAGTIRWFERGTNVDPPYDLIVSAFRMCFDYNRELYPGSRDRAYYSGRAILWIHVLAKCKSDNFASIFPLPTTRYIAPDYDHDLTHLLTVNSVPFPDHRFVHLLNTQPGRTLSHSRWVSNVLLHLSWANRTAVDFDFIHRWTDFADDTITPVDTMLNRLLTWCIFLGSPVEEDVLKVQDKSDCLERILHKLSKAIVLASATSHPHRTLLPDVLQDLTELENRPKCLTNMVYEWCSVICENRQSCEYWEQLVLCSLEIGFRHLTQYRWISVTLTHTEHHRELVDVVFKSEDNEAIADLLQAWTAKDILDDNDPLYTLLGTCVDHLVGLQNVVPFTPRLRQLVIRSVELIGYEGFKEGGAERFIGLLDHLHVGVDDVHGCYKWISILLDVIQSPEGARRLSIQHWGLLVELTISVWWRYGHSVYSPQVTKTLLEAQEWDRLECWIGIVWIEWPPQADAMEEDLEHVMVALFRQRPDAVQQITQKITRRIERWGELHGEEVPVAFKRICEQQHWAAQLDARSSPPPNGGTEEVHHLPPSAPLPSSKVNAFWESLPLI